METVTVCLAGPPEVAAKVAKKGTESDFTLYNLKKGDTVLVVTTGTKPEKPSAFLCTASMADAGVLVAERLDAALGEAIVAFDLLRIRAGFILPRGLAPEQLAPIIKGTVLESWPVVDEKSLQERLLSVRGTRGDGPVRVVIDHAFAVKGVGTVVLGQVVRGTLKRHAELECAPGGKRVLIRSIQMQDEDFDSAPPGSRPGLALKGVDPEEVDRGNVLCEPGSLTVSDSLRAKVRPHPLFRGTVRAGPGLHLFLGLQTRPVTLAGTWPGPGKEGEMGMELDRTIAFAPGDRGILLDQNTKGLRFAASVEVIGQ